MSLSDALRRLRQQWLLLLLVPVALSASTYFFARDLPKVYSSTTTIYTGIASGYTLTGDAEGDYNKTSIAFDNLLNLITTRSTKEEVIYQLLASHLWVTSQRPALLDAQPYIELRESVPAELRRQLTGNTHPATLLNVRRYAQASTANPLYQLVNSDNSTYSLAALSRLTAARVGSSDLIQLEFESYHPEICRATLTLVTQILLQQSQSLRSGQTASVIAYYEAELRRAQARLAAAESKNLAFNRDNNIVDYGEQSKNIATGREALTGELTQVSQQYAGAQAALKAINRRLGGQEASLLSSRQVLEQRQKLSRLNARIADQQLFSQQEGSANTNTKQLQAEAEKTAQAIQNSVDSYYTHSNSTEGIPSKDLLAEWVQAMVLTESNGAKLAVLNRRQQEFEREYQRMAPLGATLKQIEREIELAEKAYLAVLTSLNASKAQQQNTQLTANLKIIDLPNLPARPKTNKLRMLVLLSGLGGFIFVTSLVLGMGLLDKSLRSPSIAARQIGLPIAGIMLDTQAKSTPLLHASKQRSLNQLVRHILLQANSPTAPTPFVVGVFSVQRQEGKTTLCQALAQRCLEMGVQILTLYPDDKDEALDVNAHALFYPAEAAAVQGWPLEELIQQALPKHVTQASAPQVQVVLVEFPALREEALPVGVLRQLNQVFLTVPATRAWRLTDHQTVERLRAATPAPVEVVLSSVALHNSEEALG